MLFQFASLITLIASTYFAAPSPAHLPLSSDSSPAPETLAQIVKPGPQKNPDMLGLKLTAEAAIVLDRASGQILFAKNAQTPLPQASLTKITTAVTVLDNRVKGEDRVLISKNPVAVQSEGADMKLVLGEEITIYNLLRGLLMSSANDAAIALAEHIAGSEEKFVELMNRKVRALGLQNSHFQNTHGLDQENHYSSAYDLAQVTRYALDKKVFREIINTPLFIFETNKRKRWLKNTNELLENPYLNILGGKTGFTDEAGRCLMEVARDNQGHEIIVIVLNSEDRWQESKGLIDWTFRAYTWP